VLDDEGVADIARNVTGCLLTPETRARSALDDLTSDVRQVLPLAA